MIQEKNIKQQRLLTKPRLFFVKTILAKLRGGKEGGKGRDEKKV